MSSQTGNVAGNYFDKYGSRNPLVQSIVGGFLRSFDALYEQTKGDSVIECGVGEGELLSRSIRPGRRLAGFDLDPDIIEIARANLDARDVQAEIFCADLTSTDLSAYRSDIVVCCEVLEHVVDPQAALDNLEALSNEWLLLSVPREPLWRILNMMRFRYLGDLGNTPGHINHWSQKKFIELIASRFEIVDTRAPVPWTMLVCRKKNR
jgi:2-polyprenyl-3-methyl-5-hydroxy-6-metoxy-1,4-benzoquinol methylase